MARGGSMTTLTTSLMKLSEVDPIYTAFIASVLLNQTRDYLSGTEEEVKETFEKVYKNSVISPALALALVIRIRAEAEEYFELKGAKISND